MSGIQENIDLMIKEQKTKYSFDKIEKVEDRLC